MVSPADRHERVVCAGVGGDVSFADYRLGNCHRCLADAVSS